MFSNYEASSFDSFLKNLTKHSGVYRMYNKISNIIYIGKAKNLHKRINSYFNKKSKDLKTQALVRNIAYIDTIITPTDYEACLLKTV